MCTNVDSASMFQQFTSTAGLLAATSEWHLIHSILDWNNALRRCVFTVVYITHRIRCTSLKSMKGGRFCCCFQSPSDFTKVNIDEAVACVSVRACVCAHPFVASHISETSEVNALTFDKVTTWVTGMHPVLTILTLTFAKGHTYLNHENDKCSIISKSVQEIPIHFAVKIVRRKV